MRPRTVVGAGGAALVAAVLLTLVGPAGTATAVPITGPMNGVLVVQLTAPAGYPLAGISVEADNEDSQEFTGTADATGRITLTGLNTEANLYTIGITAVPDIGITTVAPVVLRDTVPVTATPTTFTVPLSVGGTLSGRLVDHVGAPLARAVVTANQAGTYLDQTATTDAAGRYTLHGLEPGVITMSTDAEGSAGGGDWPVGRSWNGYSVPGATRAVPTILVHTGYDLDVDVTTLRTREPISGAIVRVHDTTTGAAFDERTSYTVHLEQDVAFDIPSGTYTVELITRATLGHPTQEFWSGTNGDLTLDASAAVPVTVTYGSDGLHEVRVDAVLRR